MIMQRANVGTRKPGRFVHVEVGPLPEEALGLGGVSDHVGSRIYLLGGARSEKGDVDDLFV